MERAKKWAVIDILIRNGANPVGLLCNQNTSFDVLKRVISQEADINTSYKGYNTLHAAATSVENHDEKISY